jgi:hypothetical protein
VVSSYSASRERKGAAIDPEAVPRHKGSAGGGTPRSWLDQALQAGDARSDGEVGECCLQLSQANGFCGSGEDLGATCFGLLGRDASGPADRGSIAPEAESSGEGGGMADATGRGEEATGAGNIGGVSAKTSEGRGRQQELLVRLPQGDVAGAHGGALPASGAPGLKSRSRERGDVDPGGKRLSAEAEETLPEETDATKLIGPLLCFDLCGRARGRAGSPNAE